MADKKIRLLAKLVEKAGSVLGTQCQPSSPPHPARTEEQPQHTALLAAL